MAILIRTTPGNTGFDMRLFDFDAQIGTQPVSAFNAFVIQWKTEGSQYSAALLGDDLNPIVAGGQLTGLTGTRITQFTLSAEDFNIGFTGMSLNVRSFFSLVRADDWAGLAELVRAGDDRVVGTANNDTLLGGDGNDTILGGAGRDNINGGRGNDTLEATEGRDVLTGGRGADTFQFAAPAADGYLPTIKDFTHGVDRIAVSDTAFNHVGFGGFDGAPMEAIHLSLGKQAKTPDQGLIYDKAKGYLYYDPDGSLDSGDRILLAKFGAGTVITYEDFWVN